MSSSFKVILLLLACACLINAHESSCNHDKHQEQNPPELLDIQEDFGSKVSGRMLQQDGYPHMRIYVNFDNLAQTAPASYTSYIRDLLAPAVISYFEATLMVKYPVSGNLVISSSAKNLCSLSVPNDLRSGVAADYAILYTSRSENSNVLATSYNCNLASGSKRPLVGSTSLNRQMLVEANGDVIVHEKNTYLLMHEMIHTLGFSKSLYPYFIDATGTTLKGHIKTANIAGSTHTVIDVASLTQKLRDFHGCSSIPGAIMENGDDSHWDKKFYLYETMQSGTISGKRISEYSLGLLEASGWYAIDYSNAEPYFYGQGQGCNFINGACSSSKAEFEEFCVGNNRGCNFVGNTGASCSSGSNMDSCKYMIPNDGYSCESSSAASTARIPSVESFGRDVGSKCFTGTLNTKSSNSLYAYCFKFNCVGEGMNTQLEVIMGANKAVCTQEGNITVDGYYGYLNCPDPLNFCNTVGKKFCPRGCMGRGECVNNQCQCNSGFTGIDCALLA